MAIDKAVDSGVLDGYFTGIANAIRGKNGSSDNYTPAQMPQAITDIPSGGTDYLGQRLVDTLTSYTNDTLTGKLVDYSFSYCLALESVSLAGITELGQQVFTGSRNLKSVNIPNATIIGDYAFQQAGYNTVAADRIVMDLKKVTTISQRGFTNCKFVKEIEFGSVLTSIGQYAFMSCSVEKITVATNSLNIGYRAFMSAADLQEIIFTGHVSSISSQAFSNDSACLLYDFSSCTSVPTLDATNAFNGINANAKIVVPDSLYSTWIAASNWANFASYIIKKSDYDAL